MTDYEMVLDFCGKKDSLIVLVLAASTNYIFLQENNSIRGMSVGTK